MTPANKRPGSKTAPTTVHRPAALTPDEREQQDLISRILSSKHFQNEDLHSLLIHLVDNQTKVISSLDITRDCFKQSEVTDVRNQIFKLREALSDYRKSRPTEQWFCELPILKRGYQIRFSQAAEDEAASPSKAFWAPHARFGKDVMIACGSHLFFHEPRNNTAFRIYDFNYDLPAAETLEKLKAEHLEFYDSGLMPWYHSYLSNGEVNAYETLLRWFHTEHSILPRRFQSREVSLAQVLNSSPILLGRTETNSHIGSLMKSARASKLGYRIHTKLGAIAIKGINQQERKALKQFPLSKDGILGPMPTTEMVFGLVSRFPNLKGNAPVTIISADSHAKAVSNIAEILTDDARAREVLEQTGWDWKKGLPETFELLFAVTISSPDLEGAGTAELLISRP